VKTLEVENADVELMGWILARADMGWINAAETEKSFYITAQNFWDIIEDEEEELPFAVTRVKEELRELELAALISKSIETATLLYFWR